MCNRFDFHADIDKSAKTGGRLVNNVPGTAPFRGGRTFVAGSQDIESFNLLLNPFVVLSVTPSATKEEIAEAFDDKLTEEPADEELLRDARRTLLIPNQRLAAELSYLFDTPEKSVRLTLDRLDDPSASDLRSLARTLPPLSRLNMLGHIAASSCDSELLVSYVDARTEIDHELLGKRLNQTRTAAGFSKPSANAIESALQLLVERHCASMLESYDAPQHAAEDMRKCVEYFLRSSPSDHNDALAPLLKSYRGSIVTEQSKHGVEVDAAIDAMTEHPGDDRPMAALRDALQKWDRLSQPLQLFEQSMDRDEPESRAMFEKIRALSLDLANNHEGYETSLALSSLCRDIFAELPRAVEQLDNDIEILDERVLATGAAPLIELIAKIEDSPHGLAAELKRSGFGSTARGTVGELYAAFQAAIEKFSGTPSFDLPWAILRNLSLKINNDFDDPSSSLAIVEFIIKHPHFKKVSEHIRSQIEEDEVAVRINVHERDLLGAVSAKNYVAAEEAARQLTLLVKDPDKKREFSQILQGLQQRNKPKLKVWRYVIGAAVVFMIVSSLMDQKSKSTYRPNSTVSPTRPPSPTGYPAPTRPTVPATSPDTGKEVKPPSGIDITLTIENVRYCVREAERLDAIKPRITHEGDQVIQLFNIDINDFNSRCSRYRYVRADMDKVTAELATRKTLTGHEADQRLERWRTVAGAPSIQPVPVPTPQTPTDPQPGSETASRHTKLDLLDLEDAAMVQTVLADLGYFDGPRNGTWGPKSKRALYLFKRANGLQDDDGFDGDTEARLFGNSATPFTEGGVSDSSHRPYVYPPPFGAKLNPLNASDAAEINKKLRDLGLYNGKQLEVWSGLSRDALSAFRASRGLPDNTPWDSQVERQLFAIR